MSVLPFAQALASEGSGFGLAIELIEHLRTRTEAGDDLASLLEDPRLSGVGLQREHLLVLRRAVWRHQALREAAVSFTGDQPVRSWVDLMCRRWARRLAPDSPGLQSILALACAAVVAATLKRGRVRLHLTRPDDPRSKGLGELAQRTEGCADLAPHRWFQADRAVADGLLRIEVLVPEQELARALGPNASPDRLEQLERFVARPVLSELGWVAERAVIRSAAGALRSLLSRSALAGVLGGVLLEQRRIWIAAVGGPVGCQRADFESARLSEGAAWLAGQGAAHVGLVQASGQAGAGELVRKMAERKLTVELVREAGLMKQARALPGPIQAAAAEVIAQRLRDPLEGYAGLEPDELGLGEYLDRVDASRLRAALLDASAAAAWDRRQARSLPGGLVRGLSDNPLIRSLEDLRPGIELDGMVVNLTHFGAFVELGLPIQGLVHLSELSERFVQHPSEVVEVGQPVRVRVVSVDLEQGRLGLSLRTDADAGRRKQRAKRGQAIKDLDDLFRK